MSSGFVDLLIFNLLIFFWIVRSVIIIEVVFVIDNVGSLFCFVFCVWLLFVIIGRVFIKFFLIVVK